MPRPSAWLRSMGTKYMAAREGYKGSFNPVLASVNSIHQSLHSDIDRLTILTPLNHPLNFP